MSLILRLPLTIRFDREGIDLAREYGFLVTRRSRFNRARFILNLGNQNSIFAPRAIILNKPEYIKNAADKLRTYKLISDFMPLTTTDPLHLRLPLIAKRKHTWGGRGKFLIKTSRELRRFLERGDINSFIFQKFLDIDTEYRINILNTSIVNVSKKNRPDDWNGEDFGDFEYTALGLATEMWPEIKERAISVPRKLNLNYIALDVARTIDHKWYCLEVNSAPGIGEFLIRRLREEIRRQYRI